MSATGPRQQRGRREDGRNAAEWTTLVLSALLLLIIAGLVATELIADREPAAPVADVDGPVERHGDAFHVPVRLSNEGEETAANVQVTASLTIDGEEVEADQVVDFLPGGATEDLVFVFQDDPADGELAVEATGFTEP